MGKVVLVGMEAEELPRPYKLDYPSITFEDIHTIISSDLQTAIIVCDCSKILCLAEANTSIRRLRTLSPNTELFILPIHLNNRVFSLRKIQKFIKDLNITVYRRKDPIKDLCASLDSGRFYCL